MTDLDDVGACSGVTSPRDACEEVAIGLEVVKSVPSRPSGSSTLVEARAP